MRESEKRAPFGPKNGTLFSNRFQRTEIFGASLKLPSLLNRSEGCASELCTGLIERPVDAGAMVLMAEGRKV